MSRQRFEWIPFWAVLSLSVAQPSIPVCCPNGTVGHSAVCSPSEHPIINPSSPWANMTTFYSPLTCDETFYLTEDEFSINDDGYLVDIMGSIYTPGMFCFGNYMNETFPFLCSTEENTEEGELFGGLHTYCMILSATALFFTAGIYGLNKTLRENPHSPHLISHTFALAMSYTALSIIRITRSFDYCEILGFLIQYFFLAAFFWLNCMCIDIHVTLRSMRPTKQRPMGYSQKFAYYSLYAWGSPLLITLTSIYLKYSDVLPNHLKPDIGDASCYLYGPVPKWIYFHGIVTIIIGVNLTLFLLTASHLLKHKNNMSVRSRSKRSYDIRYFFVYLKLFIVMGVTWIMEIISLAFEGHSPYYIWFPTDTLNALQGVLVFILFVCKKNVLTILNQEVKGWFGRTDENTGESPSKKACQSEAAVLQSTC